MHVSDNSASVKIPVPARAGRAVGSAVMDGPTADEAFSSLRRRSRPRSERYDLGRSMREHAHRADLAFWRPAPDRADPVAQIIESHAGRQDWLIPVRVGRMAASPYAFLRGTAALMADDFATLPKTGITP